MISKKTEKGFTMIELIIVMVLLSILVTVAAPLINKPYKVYEISKSLQNANDQALIVMHWLSKDLSLSTNSIKVNRKKREILIHQNHQLIKYYLSKNINDNQETLLYREVLNIISKSRLDRSIVAKDISSMTFEWGRPYLIVNLEIDNFSGKKIHLWRQMLVPMST